MLASSFLRSPCTFKNKRFHPGASLSPVVIRFRHIIQLLQNFKPFLYCSVSVQDFFVGGAKGGGGLNSSEGVLKN